MLARKTRIKDPNEYGYLFKIVMLGASGVGKTSLILRFADNIFSESFIATIGVDFKMRTIDVGPRSVKLQLWDTAGQELFRTINTDRYLESCHGFVIAIDLTNQDSLNYARSELERIERRSNGMSMLMLAFTKSDMPHERKISKEDILAFDKEIAAKPPCKYLGYIETSAKFSTNVDELFFTLARSIVVSLDDDLEEIVSPSPSISPIEEARAREVVLNIKSYILANINEFSVTWPRGSKITLDNGDEKRVEDDLALHWEEIKKAEGGEQIYYDALKEIEKNSLEALKNFSFNREPFVTKYYERTGHREDLFSTVSEKFNASRSAAAAATTTTTTTTARTAAPSPSNVLSTSAQTKNDAVIQRRYKKLVKASSQKTSMFTPPATTTTTTTKIQPEPEKIPEPPDDLCCPILLTIMEEPRLVKTSGHTYEKSAIEEVINPATGIGRDPITREEFKKEDLIRNFAVEKMIDTWHQQNPSYKNNTSASLKK